MTNSFSLLLDLLDPGALPASISGPENVWQTLADRSVALGRELLKREWQVVKAPPHTQLFLWLRGTLTDYVTDYGETAYQIPICSRAR